MTGRPSLVVLLGPCAWEGPLVAALAHPASGARLARRCLDPADLLAAAEAGLAPAALIHAAAPGVDADVVSRVVAAGARVVGVVDVGDADAAARVRRWGASAVVEVDPAAVGSAVRAVVAALTVALDPVVSATAAPADDRSAGRLVTVWGPAGAPGRSSVAVALADEAARLGVPSLLVDADTWAPSLTTLLGVVDDGPALASACRRALAGALDVDGLATLCREVRPGFLLLPGIPRAGRWSEVRASALSDVLRLARDLAPFVVVDVAAPLDSDEELVYDTQAPRRNAATLLALEESDAVVAVGAADPLGLVRLVAGLSELRDSVRGLEPRVVVTGLRDSSLGRRPAGAVADLLARHAGVAQPFTVPDDRPAFDTALRSGRTLAEAAPASPARHALRGVAVELLRDLGLREPRSLAG